MHVLSIHLNAMQPDTLARQWNLLSGRRVDHVSDNRTPETQQQQQQIQQTAEDVAGDLAPCPQGDKQITVGPNKSPKVPAPLLFHDPIALMINFILSLPVNVEQGLCKCKFLS